METEKGRALALAKLRQKAKLAGANAVINVKIEIDKCDFQAGTILVVVGNAVILNKSYQVGEMAPLYVFK